MATGVLRVGLTGGIGTGKSHIAERFRMAGIPVIDADVLAREVVAPGTAGLEAVRARFGPDVLASDGTLDRARLAGIVFGDARARGDLEAIIHPGVRSAIARFFDALPPGTPFAVADIPLLFESGREREFDTVIVAACPRQMQIERVMARDGATRDEAERRVSAQWPIDDKARRADVVIRTDGTLAETDRAVADLVATLTLGARAPTQ